MLASILHLDLPSAEKQLQVNENHALPHQLFLDRRLPSNLIRQHTAFHFNKNL
jgi:hypothetical protein